MPWYGDSVALLNRLVTCSSLQRDLPAASDLGHDFRPGRDFPHRVRQAHPEAAHRVTANGSWIDRSRKRASSNRTAISGRLKAGSDVEAGASAGRGRPTDAALCPRECRDALHAVWRTRLDRLARSTRDLVNTLATIAGKGAGFRSLADAWADTTTAHGRLMLTVLGGLAEFERELIRARTGEGRKRAKAVGVHMGRPPKLTRHQQREAIERRDAGETLTDIARSYGVSHTTIMRLTAAPDR